MPPGDVAPIIAMIVLTLGVSSVAILRGPLGKALARRLEGGAVLPDPATAARIEELLDRVGELEHQAGRLHELEERLDFAERLLAQTRSDPARLEAGRVEGTH